MAGWSLAAGEIPSSLFVQSLTLVSSFHPGSPVAQWVKSWPADLVIPSLSPAPGEIFSNVDKIPLHTAFH